MSVNLSWTGAIMIQQSAKIEMAVIAAPATTDTPESAAEFVEVNFLGIFLT